MTDLLQLLVQPAMLVWPAVSSIGAAVIVLGLLVFVHEGGHFLVAKLSGVGVLKFSLGFGKKLVGWQVGETEYMISAFPLGGYVKMLGEDEGDGEELTPEQKARSFSHQPLYKRAAIVFAGPFFNIVLAFVLFYLLFIIGFPTAIAKVSAVAPGSPAAKAGFAPGDIVEKVDGEYADFWEQVADYIKAHPGKKITFTVRHDDSVRDITATPQDVNGQGDLGLSGSVVIAALMAHSPADKAGIKPNDRVLAIDGRPVGSWGGMSAIVKASAGKKLLFTIQRGGRTFNTEVTPVLSSEEKGPAGKYGMIGVQMGTDSEKISYGPIEAIGLSAERTTLMTKVTLSFLGKLIGGKEKASQIGGPISIVQLSGREARQGFSDFVIFMALLSVNLGIINLLPVPVLDGGHLFFFGIEAIMGRPLGMRKREIAQQIGLYILIGLMIFVFYHDIAKLLGLEEMWK